MQYTLRVLGRSSAFLFVLSVFPGFSGSSAQTSSPAPASNPGLTIRFVEGEGAINNVSRGTAFESVIEVLNEQGLPVNDASVIFTLPAVGPGGTFSDGSKSLMSRTDENGRAVGRGLRPNRLAGQFEIRVTAAKGGQSATSILTQTNAAPAVERSSARKWAIVLGIVGGAAAAGIAAASGGSSSVPASAGAAALPAGTVTPGIPGFGAPR